MLTSVEYTKNDLIIAFVDLEVKDIKEENIEDFKIEDCKQFIKIIVDISEEIRNKINNVD
jgi:hypothetical protein